MYPPQPSYGTQDLDPLTQMLLDQNKMVYSATGILSKLFRLLLKDLNITPSHWNKLLNAYLDNPKNQVPPDSKSRSTARGNLRKELKKPDMTVWNFIKAIRFLNPLSFTLTIHCYWPDQTQTQYEVVFELYEHDQDTESEDGPTQEPDDETPDIQEILRDPNKKIDEAQSTLSRIFRTMLKDRQIRPEALNKLLKQYLNDPLNRIPKTGEARSQARGNLIKELKKPDMTIRNFEKGIKFLNPTQVEFIMTSYWRQRQPLITRLYLKPGLVLSEHHHVSNEADGSML